MNYSDTSLEVSTRVTANFLSRAFSTTEQLIHDKLDWYVAQGYLLLPENATHLEYVSAALEGGRTSALSVDDYLDMNVSRPFMGRWSERVNRAREDSLTIQEAIQYFCVKTIAQIFHNRLESCLKGDDRKIQDWRAAEYATMVHSGIISAIERTITVYQLYTHLLFMNAHGKYLMQTVYAPAESHGAIPPGYTGFRANPERLLWEMDQREVIELQATV